MFLPWDYEDRLDQTLEPTLELTRDEMNLELILEESAVILEDIRELTQDDMPDVTAVK